MTSRYPFPGNVVRTMRPQIEAAKRAAMHHFRNRRDGRGNRPARLWIAEVRRIDRASGYSACLALLDGGKA